MQLIEPMEKQTREENKAWLQTDPKRFVECYKALFHTLGFRDAHDRHVFQTYSQGKRCQCSVQPDHKDKRSTTSLRWFQRLKMMDNVLVSIDSYGNQAAKYSRSPSPWEEKYQLAENLFGCRPPNDKVNSQRKNKQAINQLCWTQVPPNHDRENSDD